MMLFTYLRARRHTLPGWSHPNPILEGNGPAKPAAPAQFWGCLGLTLAFAWWLTALTAYAQNGPTCDTYTNKTTTNGLGSSSVRGVYASGTTVYAATIGGLSISTDGGNSFTNKTTADGLGDNNVTGVYASGESTPGTTVYAATLVGLSISTNGGNTFTNKTTANGLGNNTVYGVYASGTTVYAAANGGLSISTDGGNSFTNKTTANGLGSNTVRGVYASGTTVYAATQGGLSISTNGGNSFTNKTTTNGLGSNTVRGVYASGTTVYAATDGGLSISTDGGNTFTNKTTANGLGFNNLSGVYASGTTVYAATSGGLSISTDGGNTFTNKTQAANGLGDNNVRGVYASGTTVYAATQGGVSFCNNAPLPVALLRFTATPQSNQTVLLNWATAWETSNKGYRIERSKDLVAFEPVGELNEVALNSTALTTYQLTDRTPFPGTSYYRLTQTDLSGKATTYPAVSVVLREEAYGVFPNPVASEGGFVLRLDEPQTAILGFFNPQGRPLPLQKTALQAGKLLLKASTPLPAGIYLLTVQERGQTRQHRLVVQ